ncbi:MULTISPECIES: hypothetical protein [unclassified Granulicatella]|uniref:hypothetical protein n=1 Tax=unclassified Granulicatella TaxID=2630493 RepID=UPI0010739467|nr:MULTISPECIES: hypothetical protein [unclassified Granulicatella]MBF0780471.1 hypothetical protein [Granulicatella sp. 19428wC4_WM01]TFU95371.1 hypothetical protein E4T68_05130 [Granulicatella sp. WM01]
MKIFEDKFMELQISMVSLSMEFVNNQADNIYIYCIADELYRFDVFYKINNKYVYRHEINNNLSKENRIDNSDEREFSMLEYGIDDIEKIVSLYKEYGKEHPTEMWIIYDAKKNSLDAKYSYEGRYKKDNALLLDPVDEFDKWFEKVKENNL